MADTGTKRNKAHEIRNLCKEKEPETLKKNQTDSFFCSVEEVVQTVTVNIFFPSVLQP